MGPQIYCLERFGESSVKLIYTRSSVPCRALARGVSAVIESPQRAPSWTIERSRRILMAAQRTSYLFLPLIIVGCSVLGGWLGPPIEVSAATGPDDDIQMSLKAFTKVYDAVEQNFADPLNPDKAIYNVAIPSMLQIGRAHV